MYIIYIKNYRHKIIFGFIISVACILLLPLSQGFIRDRLILKITINNNVSFSCPYSFKIDCVYINEQAEFDNIQTNSTLESPGSKKNIKYQSLKEKFSFDYPSIFTIREQDFGENDILFHVDFIGKNPSQHGFVQVWRLTGRLDSFLENSKKTSQLSYKYFNSRPITVNNLSGYYWDYVSLGNDRKNYKSSEVFLQKGNKMYRISYFVPENIWNKSQYDIYWGIVKSFKAY